MYLKTLVLIGEFHTNAGAGGAAKAGEGILKSDINFYGGFSIRSL